VTDAKETLRSDIRTLSIEIQSAKTELKQDLTIHVLEHHK
jgi:hypothetical protein